MISGLWYALEARGRTEIICNTGDPVGAEHAPVLRVGAARRQGGITCAMRADGVRCANRSGRGFRPHRGREEMF